MYRWRASVALALLAFAAPAWATRPVAIYPIAREAGKEEDAADVQSLLESAVYTAARRADVLPADPLVVRARCAGSGAAQLPCLAAIAGPGLVLRATVRRSGGALLASVEAVDGRGRAFGPVQASIDAYIQSAEPLSRAVLLLADLSAAPERRPVASASIPPPGPSPAATTRPAPSPAAVAPTRAPVSPPGPAPASSPSAPARPASPPAAVASVTPPPAPTPASPDRLRARPPAPASPVAVASAAATATPAETTLGRAWQRPVGITCTVAGLALAGGGATLALVNKRTADDLDRRYAAGTLAVGDRAAYDRVARNNDLTTTLLVSGGVLTAAGLTLWAVSPAVAAEPGGVRVGVSGQF